MMVERDAIRAALSLSVPTSRTCSAGIGGGETCDLPDGHEGPHSSDGIPVPTSPQMCEHSGPSLARRAIDGHVASPVDRCEQCGDDRATSAGPNCTEPNDHYPSGRSPSPTEDEPTTDPDIWADQPPLVGTPGVCPVQDEPQRCEHGETGPHYFRGFVDGEHNMEILRCPGPAPSTSPEQDDQ